jgi:hypothetical protein
MQNKRDICAHFWPARLCTPYGIQAPIQSLRQHPEQSNIFCAPRYLTYWREVRNKTKKKTPVLSSLTTLFRRWVQDYAHHSMLRLMSSIRTVLCLPLAPLPSLSILTTTQNGLLVQHPIPCASPTCSYFLLHWLTPQGARAHKHKRTHASTHSFPFHGKEERNSGCRFSAIHL